MSMVALRPRMKVIIGLLCVYLPMQNYTCLFMPWQMQHSVKVIHVHKAAYTALISKAQLSIQGHSNQMFKMGFSMFHWFNFCSYILPLFFLKSQSSKLKAFAYVQYTCNAWIEGLHCLKTLFRVSIYCIYWPWCWPFKWPVCNCWLLALNAAVAHESMHLVGN